MKSNTRDGRIAKQKSRSKTKRKNTTKANAEIYEEAATLFVMKGKNALIEMYGKNRTKSLWSSAKFGQFRKDVMDHVRLNGFDGVTPESLLELRK